MLKQFCKFIEIGKKVQQAKNNQMKRKEKQERNQKILK